MTIPLAVKPGSPLSAAVGLIGPYWAIETHYADAAWAQMQNIDFAAHAAEFARYRADTKDDSVVVEIGGDDAYSDAPYDVDASGIATINMSGVMQKRPSSWGRSCSTVMTRRAVRQAASDTNVKAIALVIDSPGGNIEGTGELSDDVFAVRGKKPIGAFIDSCGCSAAYWVASQCDFVQCTATSMVGSIGTMTVLTDTSAAAKMLGAKVHLIATAPLKGTGAPGVPITDEQIADIRRVAGELNDQFTAGVARGRGMYAKSVAKVADGRVHIGANAVSLKLVDAVATIDQFYAKLGGSTAAAVSEIGEQSQESDDEDLPGDDTGNGADATAPTQTAAESGKETVSPMRNEFAAALSKVGLVGLAAAILGAKDDTPETVASVLADQAKADAQVPAARIAAEPISARNATERDLLMEAAGAGISTSAQMKELIANAKLGLRYAAEVRASAKVEAVRAYGAEIGKSLESQCDALPIDMLIPIKDGWTAEADKRFGLGEKGQPAKRASAGPSVLAGVNAEAGNDGAASEKAWDKLSDSQKKTITSMGAMSDDKREMIAQTYLKSAPVAA